ncbi:MarR family transcriptional regulator [Robertmurraya yapensis]|uniref:MarR family transcriptional regulator n=1 Tax=Bacillus yapensis TaxID=2492960 RepID=A0A3S0KRI7_9BACI|nr:MarR family transcriptional regulator [Bacillus yapensis]RTR36150.1 MarR family transcriptional regulator [Bacillus yapensis]TKT05653.1 MarR family transcriptional regulator [Bacillus yapensis]
MSMDKFIGSASVRLSKKMTRIINHYLKPYHITTEQWAVLRTLHESDQITQKDLSVRTDKDQATLTKILDLIENRELIKRVPNPTDRRSFLIEITDKGASLVEELTNFIEEIFTKIVNGIEHEKLATFQEVLHSLETNIEHLLEIEE